MSPTTQQNISAASQQEPQAVTASALMRHVTERFLMRGAPDQPVVWESDHEGYGPCPGAGYHTNPTGSRHLKIYVHDEAPRPYVVLHCVHANCEDMRKHVNKEINAEIESALRSRGYVIRNPTPEERAAQEARMAEQRQAKSVELRYVASRSQIIREHPWSLEELVRSSRLPLPPPSHGWRLFVGQMFAPDEVIWMGEKTDSGQPHHAQHFRSAAEWLRSCPYCPYPFTTAAIFKPGSIGRTQDNIVRRRYFVFESDVLTIEEQAAVTRFLREELGLTLRACVWTGGKSLHSWFDYPGDHEMEMLKPVLIGLAADYKV